MLHALFFLLLLQDLPVKLVSLCAEVLDTWHQTIKGHEIVPSPLHRRLACQLVHYTSLPSPRESLHLISSLLKPCSEAPCCDIAFLLPRARLKGRGTDVARTTSYVYTYTYVRDRASRAMPEAMRMYA